MTVDERLLEIRDLFRAGRLADARAAVAGFSTRRLSPGQRVTLAALANRTYQFSRAASLLHRAVHPTGRRTKPAGIEAQAEYSRALIELGAVNEGIEILQRLDASRLPRIYRILAYAYFRRWQWELAIPLLKKSLLHPGLTLVEKLASKVALATALLHGKRDFVRAERLLKGVLRRLEGELYRRMRWDAWQMLAQVYYLRQQWSRTLGCVAEMEKLYVDAPESLTVLVARKWRTLVELSTAKDRAVALYKLGELKKEFGRCDNWIQVRDLDFYLARATNDRGRLVHLYYGTPLASARARILRELKVEQAAIPEFYDLQLRVAGAAHAMAGESLDILNGANSLGSSGLKPRQALQRLLEILVSDFYCPPNVVQLHEALYPGEHFNPLSSSVRVRQVLRRLRAWLKKNGIPLAVEEKSERYFLVAQRPLRLRLRREQSGLDAALSDLVQRLKKHFGANSFKAGALEALMKVSRPTAVALLARAMAAQLVVRAGHGPQTRYRLA